MIDSDTIKSINELIELCINNDIGRDSKYPEYIVTSFKKWCETVKRINVNITIVTLEYGI